MQCLKKLKIILNSNVTYILLFILLIIDILYLLNNTDNKSVYDINTSEFIMTITDYQVKEDKVKLELKDKEILNGTLYLKNTEEYEYYKNNLKYGLKVRVNGTLKEVNNNTVPNTFNYKEYLENNNSYYTLNIEKLEIIDERVNLVYKYKNIINKRIEKLDDKGYMKAFILGDKAEIDTDMYSRYQVIGVTHLFALSGMHIGLLSAILFKLLKKVNDKIKYLLVIMILIFYGCIVGFPSSIKRCIIFFILGSINKVFKLNVSTIKILLLTIFILILSNYKIIGDVAFLYSVGTVMGIILFSDYIKDRRKVVSSLKLSFIAFLFSMPITLYTFYSINFMSIIYNLVYIPLVSVIVYPLSLLSFICPVFVNVFDISIVFLEGMTNFLAKIDWMVVYLKLELWEIGLYYVLVIFSYFKKQKLLYVCVPLILMLHFILLKLDSNAYVFYFDVGQGDSALIITPYRKEVILIDTGGLVSFEGKNDYLVSDNVITFLKSKSIRKISKMILSHGDFDHLGETMNYIEEIDVEEVIFNAGNYNELENNIIKELSNRDIKYSRGVNNINLSDITLYFLNTRIYDNENDCSSVVYVSIYGTKFLFMGDAGIDKEEDIIKKYEINKVDFLKVGHHGSDTSSGENFIKRVQPTNCIISVGAKNRYGHPKKSVINILDDYCNIYRTDSHGSIEVIIGKDDYKVKKYSP